ncbi:hypothetical protein GCM10009804_22980 [Kribbella hippodromi]|uniref:Nudix hydrolase domain-containing protein n=1 Tax=Kribbella hippodromi TaxID=434347 RepID=A0ABP4NTQ2_9ACTN
MGLRSTRHMTSVFLVRDGGVLLLFRRGSRVIADSWVGIGGHLEPHEHTDPTAAALRELHEEIGVTADQLTNLSMRYVALRDTGTELRTTYYFTADLHPDAPIPAECVEGELRWFDLTIDPTTLEMPPSARYVLPHWLKAGRHDDNLRFLTITPDDISTGPF